MNGTGRIMKRTKSGAKVLAVAALTALLAAAAPACAEQSVSGFYRLHMVTDNLKGAPAKDKAAESQVDNRLRMMYKNTLNEYVYFVYFAEIDTLWGQKSKGSIGGGGEAGADGVNVETKNAYLDFKIPGSIFAFRTGIQGFADNFDNAFVSDDMAGLRAHLTVAPNFSTDLGYFKFYENLSTDWDDVDFYTLQNSFKLGDNLSLGADFYWRANASGKVIASGAALGSTTPVTLKSDDLYVLGASAKAKVADLGLTGWLAYQFGKQELLSGGDANYGSLGASAKATIKFGPANTGLRLTYFSKDDSAKDAKTWQQIALGNVEFNKENLSIFFTDPLYCNTASGRHALTDAAEAGFGLFGVNATADVKLPADFTLYAGAGYFMALADKANGATSKTVDGKDLGFEVAARIATKVATKVDVSLGGAYAFLGSFYKAPGAGSDPDNLYKMDFMINTSF